MKISKRIEWCMGHRLANHAGKCRSPHGHQYVLEVEFEGEVNQDQNSEEYGMVVDFGIIKTILQNRVHDVLDHGFLFDEKDVVMREFYASHPDLKHCPVPFAPTAENMVSWIQERISQALSEQKQHIRLSAIKLWETPYNYAFLEIEKHGA